MPLGEESFAIFSRNTVSDTGTYYETFCINGGTISSNGDLFRFKTSQAGFRLSPFNETELVLAQDSTLRTHVFEYAGAP